MNYTMEDRLIQKDLVEQTVEVACADVLFGRMKLRSSWPFLIHYKYAIGIELKKFEVIYQDVQWV